MTLNFLYVLLCSLHSYLQYLKALFYSCESFVNVQNKLCQMHLLLFSNSFQVLLPIEICIVLVIPNTWIDLLCIHSFGDCIIKGKREE